MLKSKKNYNRKSKRGNGKQLKDALPRYKVVNLFAVVAKKDIKYYSSIYVLGTGGKQFSFSSGGDVRYLTLGTIMNAELSNVSSAYKYFKINAASARIKRVTSLQYAYILPQLYLNFDMANSGGNPTNTNVLEATTAIVHASCKVTESGVKYVGHGMSNWTIAVFDVWQASAVAPTQGAFVIGSDITGTSTTVDQIYVVEFIISVSLACNI